MEGGNQAQYTNWLEQSQLQQNAIQNQLRLGGGTAGQDGATLASQPAYQSMLRRQLLNSRGALASQSQQLQLQVQAALASQSQQQGQGQGLQLGQGSGNMDAGKADAALQQQQRNLGAQSGQRQMQAQGQGQQHGMNMEQYQQTAQKMQAQQQAQQQLQAHQQQHQQQQLNGAGGAGTEDVRGNQAMLRLQHQLMMAAHGRKLTPQQVQNFPFSMDRSARASSGAQQTLSPNQPGVMNMPQMDAQSLQRLQQMQLNQHYMRMRASGAGGPGGFPGQSPFMQVDSGLPLGGNLANGMPGVGVGNPTTTTESGVGVGAGTSGTPGPGGISPGLGFGVGGLMPNGYQMMDQHLAQQRAAGRMGAGGQAGGLGAGAGTATQMAAMANNMASGAAGQASMLGFGNMQQFQSMPAQLQQRQQQQQNFQKLQQQQQRQVAQQQQVLLQRQAVAAQQQRMQSFLAGAPAMVSQVGASTSTAGGAQENNNNNASNGLAAMLSGGNGRPNANDDSLEVIPTFENAEDLESEVLGLSPMGMLDGLDGLLPMNTGDGGTANTNWPGDTPHEQPAPPASRPASAKARKSVSKAPSKGKKNADKRRAEAEPSVNDEADGGAGGANNASMQQNGPANFAHTNKKIKVQVHPPSSTGPAAAPTGRRGGARTSRAGNLSSSSGDGLMSPASPSLTAVPGASGAAGTRSATQTNTRNRKQPDWESSVQNTNTNNNTATLPTEVSQERGRETPIAVAPPVQSAAVAQQQAMQQQQGYAPGLSMSSSGRIIRPARRNDMEYEEWTVCTQPPTSNPFLEAPVAAPAPMQTMQVLPSVMHMQHMHRPASTNTNHQAVSSMKQMFAQASLNAAANATNNNTNSIASIVPPRTRRRSLSCISRCATAVGGISAEVSVDPWTPHICRSGGGAQAERTAAEWRVNRTPDGLVQEAPRVTIEAGDDINSPELRNRLTDPAIVFIDGFLTRIGLDPGLFSLPRICKDRTDALLTLRCVPKEGLGKWAWKDGSCWGTPWRHDVGEYMSYIKRSQVEEKAALAKDGAGAESSSGADANKGSHEQSSSRSGSGVALWSWPGVLWRDFVRGNINTRVTVRECAQLRAAAEAAEAMGVKAEGSSDTVKSLETDVEATVFEHEGLTYVRISLSPAAIEAAVGPKPPPTPFPSCLVHGPHASASAAQSAVEAVSRLTVAALLISLPSGLPWSRMEVGGGDSYEEGGEVTSDGRMTASACYMGTVDMSQWDAELQAISSVVPEWLQCRGPHDMLRFARYATPGINVPMLTLSVPGAWIGGREGLCRLRTVCLCHGPGAIEWGAVDASHVKLLRDKVLEEYSIDILGGERQWFPDSEWLRRRGIPVMYGIQKPGDAVIFKGGTIRWSRSLGATAATSWSLGYLEAFQIGSVMGKMSANREFRPPRRTELQVALLIMDVAQHLLMVETLATKVVAAGGSADNDPQKFGDRPSAMFIDTLQILLKAHEAIVRGILRGYMSIQQVGGNHLGPQAAAHNHPAYCASSHCSQDLSVHSYRCVTCEAGCVGGTENGTQIFCNNCIFHHIQRGHAYATMTRGPMTVQQLQGCVNALKGVLSLAQQNQNPQQQELRSQTLCRFGDLGQPILPISALPPAQPNLVPLLRCPWMNDLDMEDDATTSTEALARPKTAATITVEQGRAASRTLRNVADIMLGQCNAAASTMAGGEGGAEKLALIHQRAEAALETADAAVLAFTRLLEAIAFGGGNNINNTSAERPRSASTVSMSAEAGSGVQSTMNMSENSHIGTSSPAVGATSREARVHSHSMEDTTTHTHTNAHTHTEGSQARAPPDVDTTHSTHTDVRIEDDSASRRPSDGEGALDTSSTDDGILDAFIMDPVQDEDDISPIDSAGVLE